MYLQSIGQKCVLIGGEVGWGQSESDLLYALELHTSFVKKLGRHRKHCDKCGK